MTVVQLLIGLATLVVNAFFVGAEFALISVRRSQIEPLAQAGDRRARSVLWGLEHVSALLAAAQLGITLCTLVLGVVAEPAIAHLLEPVFHAVGMPTGAGARRVLRDRADPRHLSAHAAGRDGPQEHRPRRTGAQRADAGPAAGRGLPGRCAR